MKQLRAAIFSAILVIAGVTQAIGQSFPLTMPANTVYGRLGVSTGPGSAIPLSVLSGVLSLTVDLTSINSGTDTGLLYNKSSKVGNATAASINTSGGYQFFGVGDAISTGISRSTGTKPTALMLSRLVNWGSINDSTVVDYSTLTAQSSVSNQYASFAAYPIMTSTAFNWNHLIGFEDLGIVQGSGTLTNQASFYSAPTISGTTTNRRGMWVSDAGGAGTITNQYGFICDAMTRGTANWCFYATASTPSYFGGNVLIGTAGTAPTTARLTLNKNTASPPSVAASTTILQAINADGVGTIAELRAYGTGAVPGIAALTARGTKASPTATQSGDTLTSWYGTGYGATTFGSFDTVMQATALENFSDTAHGSAWDFYTTDVTTTSLTQRMRLAKGLAVGSTTDPGAGIVSALNGFTVGTAAKTLVLKQGANGTVGTFVCTSGGSITVNNTNVAISDAIIISLNTAGGTISTPPAINAITASTSFVAKCATNDTATYNYAIIKNAA